MKVGIAGLGVIGKRVAQALAPGLDCFVLEAVTSGDRLKAERSLQDMDLACDVVSAAELARRCDVVVECAPKAAFREILTPCLEAGRLVITVSAAPLIANMDVVELARSRGGRIILATGALLGLDAVRAAAEGAIHTVTMTTRKPPRSLLGAPYLKEHGIDVASLHAPLKVFEGTARDGAAGFPANVNVAAALALAGIGPDRTQLTIWADPGLERNTHTIRVDADSARFEMTIENIPSLENPGTGRITALSIIAALRSLAGPLKIGT